jgi:hypothetical protein
MTIAFDDPVQAQMIPELMIARRAFPVAQELLAGAVLREASASAQIGWHDTTACAETGAIALVPPEGELTDLIGDTVVVKRHLATETRGVYVYVLARAAIPDALSLSRRAFLHLGPLASETIDCSVEVIA